MRQRCKGSLTACGKSSIPLKTKDPIEKCIENEPNPAKLNGFSVIGHKDEAFGRKIRGAFEGTARVYIPSQARGDRNGKGDQKDGGWPARRLSARTAETGNQQELWQLVPQTSR